MPKKIDIQKLQEITEQFGGWEKIVSAQYEPSEELLEAFEAAGLSRKAFEGLRIEATWTPRERAIRHIAREFDNAVLKALKRWLRPTRNDFLVEAHFQMSGVTVKPIEAED